MGNRVFSDESIHRNDIFRIYSSFSNRIRSIFRHYRFVPQRSSIETTRAAFFGPFAVAIAVAFASVAHCGASIHLRRKAERSFDVSSPSIQSILEGRSAGSVSERSVYRSETEFDRIPKQNRSLIAASDDQSESFTLFSSNRCGFEECRPIHAAKHCRIHFTGARIVSIPRCAANEREMHSNRRRCRDDEAFNEIPHIQNVFCAQTERLSLNTGLFSQSSKPDV